MVRRLPAKVVELKLNGARFAKPEDERIPTEVKTRPGGGHVYGKRDPDDGEPEAPPEFERFSEQIGEDDKHIVIPRFNPPSSPEQSRRLLKQLQVKNEFTGVVFILCVEPSQRKPLAGPRMWAESAGSILSVKNGVLRDLQSGAAINFRRGSDGIVADTGPGPQSCTEALRQLLANGPIPYRKARAAVLDLGFREKTFRNAVWQLSDAGVLEKLEYVVWKGDGTAGPVSLPTISDDAEGQGR